MTNDELEQKRAEVNQLLEAARSVSAVVAEAEATLATVKQKRGEVDATAANLAALVAAAQVKAAEMAELGSAANASKTQIADLQAVIAVKSEHIQDAQEHADKVRAELDRVHTAASQQATEAEGERVRAKSSADSITELLAEMRGHKATAEAELATTVAARDEARTAAATSRSLAEIAQTIEERIKTYEAGLKGLEQNAKLQLETITGLLPGATAAGLAHAFNGRRQTFLKPATRWQWLFVASVILLVLLALSGLWNVYRAGAVLQWDELGRVWAARLPIAGALIWLAIYASHESALAKRLEEDYGYKAAIAASFLGFQKQMAEIGASAIEGSPLAKLCEDTLATIGSPPGRIYDKHQLIVTPSDELASAAKKLFEVKIGPSGEKP